MSQDIVSQVAAILTELVEKMRNDPATAESKLGLPPTADVVGRWIGKLHAGTQRSDQHIPVGDIPSLLGRFVIQHDRHPIAHAIADASLRIRELIGGGQR